MAAITKEALNAASPLRVVIFTGNLARVGFGVSGTWVGTLTFYVSYDGANFIPVSVTPFATGATTQTVTANGNWYADVQNAVAFAVAFTSYTSGTANVVMAAANDGSWQDAFLAATSIYISQNVGSGAQNQQTVAAQANRAWRCRSLTVGFSVAAAAGVDIKITDGASSVLWEGFVPPSTNGISGGGTFECPLPKPDPSVQGSGGVVGTPGNSMVITLAAPGGAVVSTVNAELHAA